MRQDAAEDDDRFHADWVAELSSRLDGAIQAFGLLYCLLVADAANR